MSPTTYIYIDDRALKNIIDTQGGTECDAIAREGTMRTVFIIPKKIWGTGGISKQMKLKIWKSGASLSMVQRHNNWQKDKTDIPDIN